jgi:hypothetical protein
VSLSVFLSVAVLQMVGVGVCLKCVCVCVCVLVLVCGCVRVGAPRRVYVCHNVCMYVRASLCNIEQRSLGGQPS